MSETFYIRTRRGVEGPVSRERVLQLVARNQLGSLDELSSDGQTWTRIRRTEFWGSPNRVSTSPSPISTSPMNEPVAPVPEPSTIPRMSADRSPQKGVNSDTVSRIDIGSISGDRRWRLPTMDEESSDTAAGTTTPNHVSPAILMGAGVCVLLAFILGIVLRSQPDRTPTTPEEALPTSPQTTSEDDRGTMDPEKSSDASIDSDYPGTEVGGIDPGDYPPAMRPVVDYLTPSFSELRQILKIIQDSPHVSRNPVYSALTQRTRLNYYPEDDILNAFASGVDEQRGEGWPTMVVLGGAARFARLVGAVIATEEIAPQDDINRYPILFSELANRIEKTGCISISDTTQVLDECSVPIGAFQDESWLSKAKKVSMGILLGIMAHETGHLALAHVVSGASNKERTRNQEREADSFASSVGSGEWFAEPMFWGQLYFHLALSINESGNGNDTGSDHPFSRERLLNLIRSNRTLAADCGFTEDGMRAFLDDLNKRTKK